MTVILADIDLWQPSAVREVAAALGKRGASADEVKTGLSKLPLLSSWHGSGADAARTSLDKLSTHLAAHVDEMEAVGKATNKAADEIETVKEALNGIDRDAQAWGFNINRATGEITPTNEEKIGTLQYSLQQAELQERIGKVLTDGNTADADLARAITTAGKDATGPTETRPEVRAALSGPIPDDPNEFRNLWASLSPDKKDWLYSHDHFIGNHPGMPWDPKDHLGKDHYNRQHLPELIQDNQAEIDRLRAQHPNWADGKSPFLKGADYALWKQQWDEANHTHEGYIQVQKALDSPDGLPRLLGVIDDKGHAALAINNPDTAKRTATFVPGTGQDLARFDGSVEKSEAMLQATVLADPNHLHLNDVSVTTWMAYDRPMNVLEAASTSPAHNGADALDSFQAGLRASHNDALTGGPSINTVIGHSYGSTLIGAAGLDGHLDANNVVAVASPGMLAGHTSDINLAPGAHVFTTRADNDVIYWATGMTLGKDTMLPTFGATPFDAAPGSKLLGALPTINAHSSYWSDGNPALINMGKIIAGQYDVTPSRFKP